MRELIRKTQTFFSIDNPFLLVSFLLLIVISRFSVTYFNDSHTAIAPDVGFYAGEFVGHDLIYATTDQANRLVQGLPMDKGVGYGYTFTILTAWILEFFDFLGLCDAQNSGSCDFLFYKIIVLTALIGLVSTVFILVKDRSKQAMALLFLSAFLLGVPGGMGLESGNLDILLTVIFGYTLYFQKLSLDNKKRLLYPILLGCLFGALIQTKLFFIPIALVFLICSVRPLHYTLSLFIVFGVIAIIPGFYNAPINPLYTFEAAQYLRQATALSEGIVYGNNDTRAMIGGIVFEIPGISENEPLRKVLINGGGLLLFLSVLILPLLTFRDKVYKRLRQNFPHERLQYSFFVVLSSYAVTAMILWPEVSLGYRLYYLVPLLFILIENVRLLPHKQSLGLAIGSLLTRSLFLWHTRILHVFLISFFYFFLQCSIALWVGSQSEAKGASLRKSGMTKKQR